MPGREEPFLLPEYRVDLFGGVVDRDIDGRFSGRYALMIVRSLKGGAQQKHSVGVARSKGVVSPAVADSVADRLHARR